MSRRQMLGEGSQVREYACPRRELAIVARLGSLAGEHEHGLRAGCGRGLQIALRVAHHIGVVQRDIEAARDLEQHSRLRLAARAARLGGVRAEEEGVDAAADLPERAHQRFVDREQRARVEQAARDARLVGGHHDAVIGLREPCDRLEAARNRAKLLRRLDVLVAVVVDGAVAIEDDELHCASFEMSATRFIASRRSRSNARRLWRRSSSLAITMTESKKASTGCFSTAKLFR